MALVLIKISDFMKKPLRVSASCLPHKPYVFPICCKTSSFLQAGKYIALFTRHKLTRVRPGLKLTQVVFTRHFSKLTRVEPGLAVFTRQKLTRASFNPGRTRVSLCRVNRTSIEIGNGRKKKAVCLCLC